MTSANPNRDPAAPQIKTLALIDESALLAAARTCNRSLDWLAIRSFLIDDQVGQFGEAMVFVGLPPASHAEYQEQRTKKLRFCHWLKTHGFMVMTRDGAPSGDGYYKASVDLLMAIEGLELCDNIKPSLVVLVTADPDFAHLSLTLRRRGIRVELAAIEQNVSSDLRGSVNDVLDLRPLFNRFENLRVDVPPHPVAGNVNTPGTLAGRYIPDVEDLEDLGPKDGDDERD
ncbi:MAG: NYN domain-containing protein [Gemmataceae bacterium]|nr:NYN domain-containing protein [Gemmataceae bacterium]